MTTATFTRQLSQTVSTKKAPFANGKFGVPAEYLTGILATVKTSLSSDISNRETLETPYELFELFTVEADIQEGHILVYDGVDYPIRTVADWVYRDEVFLRLVIEELKA
jgi:hypothetical protein